MDLAEAKKKIQEKEKVGLLKEFNVKLIYNHSKVDRHISDLYQLYKFVSKEVVFWNHQSENLKKLFNASINHFTKLKNEIENFLNDNRQNTHLVNNIINATKWNHHQVITSNTPEVEFLISLDENYPYTVLESAFKYFFFGSSNIDLTRTHHFEGYILAFEFRNKEFKPLSRTKAEKPAISRLRNEFEADLDDYRSQLEGLLAEYELKSQEFFNQSKTKQQSFDNETNTWRSNFQEKLTQFKGNKIEEFSELKQEYREQLRMRTAVNYWKSRAKKMRRLGRWYTAGVIIGVLAIAGTISIILLNPDIIPSFGENAEQAVKWTILFIAAVSFMAFVVRAFTKLMFSSFHLARDAEERLELTHSYLSLRNESGDLTPDERLMAIQSLFSRAESGILRDDSSPAMPNDIVSRILKSGAQ